MIEKIIKIFRLPHFLADPLQLELKISGTVKPFVRFQIPDYGFNYRYDVAGISGDLHSCRKYSEETF